ncbi:Uncharacterised protein [Serratia marcescens]|nr:Uncharacterised protein [Serratia marcescens]CVB51909.1 Uncharacterised protein [Serratia marcescens]CVB93348.1 Uncharacterised protein [Serratia marcescens]CVF19188.1 Uncharacterised protein [Serratia marcescens]
MIRYTFGNPDRYHAVKGALLASGYKLQSVCHQGTGTILVDHPEEGREAPDEIYNQASGALRAQPIK